MRRDNSKVLLMSVTSLILMVGCGGSSGGGGFGGGPSAPSFAQYNDQAVALVNRTQDLPISDPATLPTSGTATYRGVMAVETSSVVAAGEMTMNANFGAVTNPITGSVNNIVNDSNQRYSGSLAIGNSSIDRAADVVTDYTFSASLTGQLGLDNSTSSINGQLAGDFLGTDHRAAEGIVAGTISNLTGSDFFQGGFIVER